jgi:hypothetical protein
MLMKLEPRLRCSTCKEMFDPPGSWQKYEKVKYCSWWCRGIGKRKNLQKTLGKWDGKK